MATFDTISYIYVPTAPRTTNARRKFPLQQSWIRGENSRTEPSSVALDTPRPQVVVGSEDNGSRGRAKTGTVYSGNSKENDGDDGLLTIEELLQTTLRNQGFGVGDPDTEHTMRGVGEVNPEERGRSVDQSTLAFSGSSSGDQNNPIVLGEDESSASEAEIDCDSLGAGSAHAIQELFSSTKTASNSRIPTPPSSPEQETLTFDSMRPSSEPLHGRIGTEDPFTGRAGSEPTTSLSVRHRSQSQEGHLDTDRNTTYKHEPVRHQLDTDIYDGENGTEQDEDVDGEQPQQGINTVAAALTEKIDDIRLPSQENESARPAKRQMLVPNRDPSPESDQDKRGKNADNYSNGGHNNTELDEGGAGHRPAKRQRLSPSCDWPTPQKHQQHLQWKSSSQPRRRSKHQQRSRKTYSAPEEDSAVLFGSTCLQPNMCCPSLPDKQHRETTTRRSGSQRSGTSNDSKPAITARTTPAASESNPLARPLLNAPVVDDNQDWEVRNVIGKEVVNDEVYYLVDWRPTLISGHSLGNSKELVDQFEARLRAKGESQHGKAVEFGASASRDDEQSNDDDSGLSDSDYDLSNSDNDESLTENEQRPSSTRRNNPWSALEDQRLLAYRKEDKPWKWIFQKFPGRTTDAVRMRWSMVRPRAE